ncbi:unnamed protein product [Rangifer tarandus platyrhynchus]|uniref:Uncharacterized protein n=1 Tax=Rangifer tarandus platyrhynchus TaxID=3082113 RepID=A0AC60A6B8_RANTA
MANVPPVSLLLLTAPASSSSSTPEALRSPWTSCCSLLQTEEYGPGPSLSPPISVVDRGAWHAAVQRVPESDTTEHLNTNDRSLTLVGPENSRQGSGRGAQAGCSHKAERSTAASVTATLAKASQRCRKPQFPQGLLKPRGVPRRVNSFYAGQAGNKTRLLTGLSIMETLTQTKSKGLSLGAQAGSPRLWDGRSWGSCSHSWKKVHADGALDDWKPDASKGRSGYEIMSRELTEQRRATRAPRGSEKLRRCARCQQGLREETLLPARFYLLRDPWPGGWGAEGAPSPSCSAAVHAHDQRTSNEMRWPALWGTGSSTLFR